VPNEITGNRSSTCENIRFSITSRIFFVRGPGRILAPVTNARPQREPHYLVAEILGIGDARGLLDLGQLLIEQLAIEQLARIGVLEILILDPGIGVINVTIEQVLPIIESFSTARPSAATRSPVRWLGQPCACLSRKG
jgi:hypothetical protein